MDIVILVWFFLLGTIFGSFFNVVIYRFNTGKSLGGRSHCLSCGKTLSWYELLPVVSYLAQQGKCRHCHAHITSRYLVIELLTGALFLLVAQTFLFDPVLLLLNLVIVSLLVIIVMYDLRHMIIPDALVLFLLAPAVAYTLWDPLMQVLVFPPIMALFGALIPAVLFAGLWLVSRGAWIGLGDAKLAVPLGLIVGAWGSISMFVLSFWIGAVVAVGLLLLQRIFTTLKRHRGGQLFLRFLRRPLTIKSEVPFAPFLVAAFLLVHFAHTDAFLLVESVRVWLFG